MKNKILLSFLFLTISLTGFCTVWTINNTGNTFAPATITIKLGDIIDFKLAEEHDSREVSLTSWNSNDNTALPGGFQTAFGGGMVMASQLGVGTHYYVCTPHASFGMKGIIIVLNTSGIAEDQSNTNISVYPNPSNGKFRFAIDGFQFTNDYKLELYNVVGEKIYQSSITNEISDIDISNRIKGIYFIKIFNGQTIWSKKLILH